MDWLIIIVLSIFFAALLLVLADILYLGNGIDSKEVHGIRLELLNLLNTNCPSITFSKDDPILILYRLIIKGDSYTLYYGNSSEDLWLRRSGPTTNLSIGEGAYSLREKRLVKQVNKAFIDFHERSQLRRLLDENLIRNSN